MAGERRALATVLADELAVILLTSIGHHVPEVVTGIVGLALIGAAYASRVRRNRSVRQPTEATR